MYIHRILSNMFLREQNTKLYEFFPPKKMFLRMFFFNIKFRKMFCHQKSDEKWWIILKSLMNTQPVFFVKSWPWKQYKWKIEIFLCFQNVFWKVFLALGSTTIYQHHFPQVQCYKRSAPISYITLNPICVAQRVCKSLKKSVEDRVRTLK